MEAGNGGADNGNASWHIEKGAYLGDISALCFLHRRGRCTPYLLAGTGAQLLLYDIQSGILLFSLHVFQGIRIHGVHSSCCVFQDNDGMCFGGSNAAKIAVYGERRVKVFKIQFNECVGSNGNIQVHATLDLVQTVPKFSNWVMDVHFLKATRYYEEEDPVQEVKETCNFLAVGLSDNSVSLWDVSHSCLLFEIKCQERCLLYSMSLWGDSLERLCVASGTIFNEILIWKAIFNSEMSMGSDRLQCTGMDRGCIDKNAKTALCHSLLLKRITGHEGSIFRICWSPDGTKFISASDDRSARVWICTTQENAFPCTFNSSTFDVIEGPVLFGHTARIWDCYISEKIIITASEDCCCQIWDLNGRSIATIKGHIGRGVWRCEYDMGSSVLVTGGSDSMIKISNLNDKILRQLSCKISSGSVLDYKKEVFKISMAKHPSTKICEFMDSKSEYVRCLKLAQENHLYVATNVGYLYFTDLTEPGIEQWTSLFQIHGQEPIVCLDILCGKSVNGNASREDWLAFGDGKGRATVVQVTFNDLKPEVSASSVWNAERERQLLGIYWSKSLGHRNLFTADPNGGIKLWTLGMFTDRSKESCNTLTDSSTSEIKVVLAAEFRSDLLSRIVCIDVCYEEELLFCGDQRGNLVVFEFPLKLLSNDNALVEAALHKSCAFKGAHGISSVSSVSSTIYDSDHINIRTTGKDGCICYFVYNKSTDDNTQKLLFAGVKNVPEIRMVENVIVCTDVGGANSPQYASGFTASDFLLWDMQNESEVLRVSCGGWRRPHCYTTGSMPDIQHCFAYVKEKDIHVVRNWTLDDQVKSLPKVLHTQFHGREIHSVQFVPFTARSFDQENEGYPNIAWIATGSEDGTVRLNRYSSKQKDKLDLSFPLEEHVGGSAVRSITTVSKIFSLYTEPDYHTEANCAISTNNDAPLMLFSVGAKQILTCWLLKWKNDNHDFSYTGISNEHCRFRECMLSSQWLTTYMQPRINKVSKKYTKDKYQVEMKGINPKRSIADGVIRVPGEDQLLLEEVQDDWRYLAMTAFLVQVSESLKICFVITSCSNATVSAQALLLPSRLWYEVAVLEHENTPVLSLQHVVYPLHVPHAESYQNRYLVFAGTTTGKIAVWDLTDLIYDFAKRSYVLDPVNTITALKRPQTGRGSQGGRHWRYSRQKNGFAEGTPQKLDTSDGLSCKESRNMHTGAMMDDSSSGHNSRQFIESEKGFEVTEKVPCSIHSEERKATVMVEKPKADIHRLYPFHVFSSAHQSGVNCLYISRVHPKKHESAARANLNYCIVSGGDDQALHVASFCLHASNNDDNYVNAAQMVYTFTCFAESTINSAHCSAIKGIWTDGHWVFTTGLDQRLRCWNFSQSTGDLEEYCCSIVNVPEPEALHAAANIRGYQIVVVGRGMQVIEFLALTE